MPLLLRIVKLSILAAAIFGIVTSDFASAKWAALQIMLFALPLLAVLYPTENRLIWAFWGSMFLVFQALLAPLFIDLDFVTLTPNLHEVVDVKGGIPGIRGQQVITTDLMGFRTTKKIDYANKTSFRIFAIGGSTTEQIYIGDQDTWTNILQNSLEQKYETNIEVVNTGVSGARAKNHLATLRKIAPLHPDVAVFLVGINDWNTHIARHFSSSPRDTQGLPTLIDEMRHRIELKNTPLGIVIYRSFMVLTASTNNKPKGIREEFGQYYAPQRQSLDRKTTHYFRPKTVMNEYAKEMEEISAACKQYNIKCGFITQPTGYQHSASEAFKKGFWMTPPNQDYTLDFESLVYLASLYNEYLKEFAKRHGHYLCDAAGMLIPTYENFYDDCHLNTAGAQRMGQIVSQCFQDIVTK